MMGDVGKGIRSFKQGITEEEANAGKPTAQIDSKNADTPAETSKTADKTAG